MEARLAGNAQVNATGAGDGDGPRAAAVPGAVAGSAPPEAHGGRKGLRSGRSGAPSLHVR